MDKQQIQALFIQWDVMKEIIKIGDLILKKNLKKLNTF